MILYSFRRCPYAIRARLALQQAGLHPQLREVDLKCKPPELLAASAKATVPVLLSGDGVVIDESLELMRWALAQRDPDGWLDRVEHPEALALLQQNDGHFKHHLDRFRYPDRYGGADGAEHRQQALAILLQWNQRLQQQPWLLGPRASLVDMALLPFVRQFRHSDPEAFDAETGLEPLQRWLQRFLNSEALAQVLEWPCPLNGTRPSSRECMSAQPGAARCRRRDSSISAAPTRWLPPMGVSMAILMGCCCSPLILSGCRLSSSGMNPFERVKPFPISMAPCRWMLCWPLIATGVRHEPHP